MGGVLKLRLLLDIGHKEEQAVTDVADLLVLGHLGEGVDIPRHLPDLLAGGHGLLAILVHRDLCGGKFALDDHGAVIWVSPVGAHNHQRARLEYIAPAAVVVSGQAAREAVLP